MRRSTTRARACRKARKFAIIRAYMAHHQAMTMVGIANALQDGRMRARFHAEPIMQAAELLLQERMPRDVAVARAAAGTDDRARAQIAEPVPEMQRHYTSAHSRVPRTHLLSNGRYSTMVTAAGSGYSRWRDIAITRWREDVTCDGWGAYVFLRDVRSGETWSAGYQPSVAEPDSYDVTFSEDRAEIVRSDGDDHDDTGSHRVARRRRGGPPRFDHQSRNAHREISKSPPTPKSRWRGRPTTWPIRPLRKLFIETEFVPETGRDSGDTPAAFGRRSAGLGRASGRGRRRNSGDVQFETDRARFLGRGQTIRSPAAITEGWPLSNTAGAVLDPIFSLRRRVRIPRGSDRAHRVLDHGRRRRARTCSISPTSITTRWPSSGPRRSPGRRRRCSFTISASSPNEAHLFQRLANHILYSDPTLRPPADV